MRPRMGNGTEDREDERKRPAMTSHAGVGANFSISRSTRFRKKISLKSSSHPQRSLTVRLLLRLPAACRGVVGG